MEMKKVIERVNACIESLGWNARPFPEQNMIMLGIEIRSELGNMGILLEFSEEDYLVYGMSPVTAGENVCEMLRYLTMVNYGMKNGNFEMDLKSGEIRYKTYVRFGGETDLSEETIVRSLLLPPMMYERYGNGIAAISEGWSDAETELQKAESFL
ncbi:MAG: hypothetical protein IKD85_01455 [Firmicutes bacterium]|nr:hypothetical protein [Bacillota bacterium]